MPYLIKAVFAVTVKHFRGIEDSCQGEPERKRGVLTKKIFFAMVKAD